MADNKLILLNDKVNLWIQQIFDVNPVESVVKLDRSLAAERGSQKIAVEIKTFLRPSFVRELENALGQYILYRNLLSVTDPERELYLAVSDRIYNNFFQKKASQFIVNQNQILIVVVEIQSEVISQWIR